MIIKSKKILLTMAALAGTTASILFLIRFVLKLQIKFKDRNTAAQILAKILREKMNRPYTHAFIVLGIPRGGAVVADVIAKELDADFDIVIGMKLGKPYSKEDALGALVEDDSVYLNEQLVNELEVSPEYVKEEISYVRREIVNKIGKYRGNPSKHRSRVTDRLVVLVDDGAATGATLMAAAKSILADLPRYLIIAVPVAPRETIKLLRGVANAVEVISSPSSSDFITVGQFYQDFPTIADEQVNEIMRTRKLL